MNLRRGRHIRPLQGCHRETRGSLRVVTVGNEELGIGLHTGLLQTAGVERMVENLPPGSGYRRSIVKKKGET